MQTTSSNPAATLNGGALRATSDFYGGGPAIKLVRATLLAVQALSHRLAVRAAYRLFGTPLPLKWLHRSGLPAHDWQRKQWPFEQSGVTTYTASGDPARTVLLVHGYRGDHHGLEPVIARLPELRFVSPDLPGFGASTPMTEAPHSVEGYAHWLREFTDRLGLADAVLLGHSFGSMVTLVPKAPAHP